MTKKVILVTGAAGFIGSSLIVALSKEYNLIAIDRRKPTRTLAAATPNVNWKELNIADATNVNSTFQQVKADFGKIDFVIHLAAYYHFGNDWNSEYEKTNINGTENIINAAIHYGVQRIIFTSSIAAMEPPQYGYSLNEKSPTSDYFPYARSKSAGEKIIRNASQKIPGIILRLGGVFSDWCELPPLYSLIRLWSGIGPFSRLMPGKGESGIPYIHISDVIEVIKRCILLHDHLEFYETFLASQKGAVLHKDIFSGIRQSLSNTRSIQPIYVSPPLVKIGLNLRSIFYMYKNEVSVEQPWMIKYIDRPWRVDNTYTQKKLNWHCRRDRYILEKLPVILKHYGEQKYKWIDRNTNRISGNYLYSD